MTAESLCRLHVGRDKKRTADHKGKEEETKENRCAQGEGGGKAMKRIGQGR